MTFVNFLKNRLIFNILYVSECLYTNISHILRAHISKSKSCCNVKSSTHFFHMMTKIFADFQNGFSVPLKRDSRFGLNISQNEYNIFLCLIYGFLWVNEFFFNIGWSLKHYSLLFSRFIDLRRLLNKILTII